MSVILQRFYIEFRFFSRRQNSVFRKVMTLRSPALADGQMGSLQDERNKKRRPCDRLLRYFPASELCFIQQRFTPDDVRTKLLFLRAAVVHHVLLASLLRELPYEGLALRDFEVDAGVVRLVLDELVILTREDRVQQDTDE